MASMWAAQVSQGALMDLTKAVVVTPSSLSKPEQQAVRMLVEEVEKRTRICWPRSNSRPADGTPMIAIGQLVALKPLSSDHADALSASPSAAGADGYRIRVGRGPRPAVWVVGNDERGVLFGVGRLLRELRMAKGRVALPDDLNVETSPKYALRGHQLGYRPKTNSYDAWTLPMWEQYVRDLVVFGANAVELIPPRSDDAATSPHFPLPQMQMMIEMSRLLDSYGLAVWIWYPALDADYSNPKTVGLALKEWGGVFEKLPRIDAVFVPGGDPGHTHPKYLMPFLEKQAKVLRGHHPKAEMWAAPQGFNAEWLQCFYDILKQEQPDWLTGIVFGPQVRVPLPELRAAVPKKYPIRRYPDITHSRHCQYPVPDWDLAYALTEAREVINPRPIGQATIFRLLQQYAVGFITYSEGCNDDVNKAVWSGLGWDPTTPVIDILRQYGRYFIGDDCADQFAQGLLALERNWQGPLLTNENVDTTLQQFQSMEKAASPQLLLNWRFQQALYRAYYDAYVRSRLIYETGLEDRAMDRLRSADRIGSIRAMAEAGAILDLAETQPPAQAWRSRVFELAEALYQSIRMQLSVSRYKAISVDRGANLDTIDMPLNNRVWLEIRFAEIRRLSSERDRLVQLREIVNWTNPGPGGFYDDLGNLTRQPHLVRGLGFDKDPAYFQSSLVGFGARSMSYLKYPISWWRNAESLQDAPLKMEYTNLDPTAQYKVRVVYAGDMPSVKIRMLADDRFEIHPLIRKPSPCKPLEFDIPAEATADGGLTLTWYRESGLGGNGRGCQVAEVWLIRK
ncbi:MAG: hypothetical protein JXQ73_06945 [Phycisphaerae bacterium]|nr:hypothetical protein [Phycisphaerae bacterium]